MARLIDADKLKNHYAWWDNEDKKMFDDIVDLQPTAYDVEKALDEFVEKFIYKAMCEGCSGCCSCYEEGMQSECEEWKSYMQIVEQLKKGGIE